MQPKNLFRNAGHPCCAGRQLFRDDCDLQEVVVYRYPHASEAKRQDVPMNFRIHPEDTDCEDDKQGKHQDALVPA